MVSYFSDIWRCRYFWSMLVKMDLRTRYRRSILGMGWSLLNPIAMTTVLCVVFSKIFKAEIRTYAPYLMAGLVTWNYILSVTLQGCQCFFQGESYIRQHPAPLAIYPLRTALGGTIHFLIALAVVLGLTWYFKGLGSPMILLSLVPTIVLLFVFVWSLAVLAGFANVHFQDTQHLSEIGFQILFYATPIMYTADQLPAGRLSGILKHNPLVALLDLIREPILEGRLADVASYEIACTTVLIAVCAAGLTLASLQRRLIFHL